MASYTAAQYAAQRRVTARIARANAEGVCPICGQPQARWPNGQKRMTCGSERCYLRWLPVRAERDVHDE